MTKRDLVVASTRQHRARLLEYHPRPPFAPSFVKSRTLHPSISYFFYFNNKYSLSLYVYTRGMLGCLLGFWPLVQNPAGAIMTTYKNKEDFSLQFPNRRNVKNDLNGIRMFGQKLGNTIRFRCPVLFYKNVVSWESS